MSQDLLGEIEQFLFHEARLLDYRRFRDWLDLFTEDVHYWVPTRRTLDVQEVDAELSGEDELHFMDEDKESLTRRIVRLETGQAWAEDPPSRTQHLITNVMVEPGEKPDELKVNSYFMTYRNRRESEVDLFVGERRDVVRRTEAGLKIASRQVILAQNVLTAKNMSIFLGHTRERMPPRRRPA